MRRYSVQILFDIDESPLQLHALTSGLKGVLTFGVAQGIERCRLACGGHGYSHASGIPDLYAFAVAGCTYEGENIVLLLQVAR